MLRPWVTPAHLRRCLGPAQGSQLVHPLVQPTHQHDPQQWPPCASAGIGRQSSEVKRERTEDYVKWEKQHRGLCRHEYWVGVPSQRTVAEVYNETTFRLEPAKIKVDPPCTEPLLLV